VGGEKLIDLAKLECHETKGMQPNGKLIELVIGKCPPKQGQSQETTAAVSNNQYSINKTINLNYT
jgi:hypothetical protein